uniref:Uncharacterized protein n=1 Tax=Chromera velia CCMP2878 TaxID=1169474 RepID=A0A0G4FZN6_9ALVE|eukprot:Cvel_19483.t1-p1 / transcript=Cvel_19483.t1 / gene=Cvel_19483 / organism=Chromera_velia_CCMP2878 / gene_product=hypothetical protein / transcript_product=hypothetical protein / location=Cvel_scaffold1683:31272-35723(-) / protein_length=421 / sequence_SO=supercontig / SO=protein_coding / is_pseudo=false
MSLGATVLHLKQENWFFFDKAEERHEQICEALSRDYSTCAPLFDKLSGACDSAAGQIAKQQEAENDRRDTVVKMREALKRLDEQLEGQPKDHREAEKVFKEAESRLDMENKALKLQEERIRAQHQTVGAHLKRTENSFGLRIEKSRGAVRYVFSHLSERLPELECHMDLRLEVQTDSQGKETRSYSIVSCSPPIWSPPATSKASTDLLSRLLSDLAAKKVDLACLTAVVRQRFRDFVRREDEEAEKKERNKQPPATQLSNRSALRPPRHSTVKITGRPSQVDGSASTPTPSPPVASSPQGTLGMCRASVQAQAAAAPLPGCSSSTPEKSRGAGGTPEEAESRTPVPVPPPRVRVASAKTWTSPPVSSSAERPPGGETERESETVLLHGDIEEGRTEGLDGAPSSGGPARPPLSTLMEMDDY